MAVSRHPVSGAVDAGVGTEVANRQSGWIASLVWLLIALIAWLMAHPYVGVRHDAYLYVGQALRHLYPAEFAQDVFFRYGSQDDYTWFSRLYAWGISSLGLATAHMLLVLVAQISFLTTLWLLLRRMFAKPEGRLSLIFVAAFPAIYGGGFCLAYGESFLTARNFAEPACLMGLFLLLGQRRWPALACIGVGASLHPLIALPALAVWWLYSAMLESRFYWGLTLALIPLGAAMAGKLPILTQVYDADWWTWMQWANAWLVLPSHWEYVDWFIIVSDVLALWLLWHSESNTNARRLFAAVGMVVVVGIVGSIVLAEGVRNVLFTSLQLWRGHWLMHLLAVAGLPILFIRYGRREDSIGRAVRPLLLIACLTPDLPAQTVALAMAFVISRFAKPDAITESSIWLIRRSLWLVLPLCLTKYLLAGSNALLFSQFDLAHMSWQKLVILFNLQPVALYFGVALAYLAYRVKPQVLLTACLALVVFFSIFWDRRTPWQHELEGSLAMEHPYVKYIPVGKNVYWEEMQRENVWPTWLLLRRESYYSSQQASAMLFNRASAEVLWSRRELSKPVWMQYRLCDQYRQVTGKPDCQMGDDTLDDLCAASDAPDFVVLRYRLPRPVLANWAFPASRDNGAMTYLYACSAIRAAGIKPVPGPKPG